MYLLYSSFNIKHINFTTPTKGLNGLFEALSYLGYDMRNDHSKQVT